MGIFYVGFCKGALPRNPRINSKKNSRFFQKINKSGNIKPLFMVLMDQSSLLEFATNGRKIRTDIFLEEMEKAIPWGKFLGIICPKHYSKKDNRGRKRADLETLLRVYFL